MATSAQHMAARVEEQEIEQTARLHELVSWDRQELALLSQADQDLSDLAATIRRSLSARQWGRYQAARGLLRAALAGNQQLEDPAHEAALAHQRQNTKRPQA